MKSLPILLMSFLLGCAGPGSNSDYYRLNSKAGWEPGVTPDQLPHYVTWNKAIDTLIDNPDSVDLVAQGHSLQVNIILKDKTLIQTIEPDIDTIFMVIRKCGLPCEHIGLLTE
ncbi:hypothetical protein [Thalassolituus sp. UBA2009]|uniref:hypothetical protein n=1 Tax=Thalassolituus sp. UBA2009 TaxID=1947658 RepID=UPI00257CF76C|nr:hypothetical protein [Thalassolituus sp. UBA2009]